MINSKGYWVPDSWGSDSSSIGGKRGWRGMESGYHNSQRKTDKTREKAGAEDRQKYMDAWSDMMVTIWREKIERLHVIDTYQLHQQITENVTSSGTELATIQHKFMEYGIYQDCGTGRGYEKGNGGNLLFLDERFRDGRYEPRKPREWFSRAYFASVMVLKEQMAYMYGEEFCGLVLDAIEYNEKRRGTSMRNRLWGSRSR